MEIDKVEINKKIILPTEQLSQALFGKRLNTRMEADESLKACLLPDWKNEEYFRNQSFQAVAFKTNKASSVLIHSEDELQDKKQYRGQQILQVALCNDENIQLHQAVHYFRSR